MSILRLPDRVQVRAKLLVNDGRIDTLEHRCNVACFSLFYRNYKQFYSSEISRLIPENHVFLRNVHLSRRADLYVDCKKGCKG